MWQIIFFHPVKLDNSHSLTGFNKPGMPTNTTLPKYLLLILSLCSGDQNQLVHIEAFLRRASKKSNYMYFGGIKLSIFGRGYNYGLLVVFDKLS